MKFSEFAELCSQLASVSSRKQKIAIIADALKKADGEVDILARFLTGTIFSPLSPLTLNVGPSMIYSALRSLRSARQQLLVGEVDLSLRDVYKLFESLAKAGGEGSRRKKENLLAALFSRLSDEERQLLVRLIFGELRIGVNEGTVIDAIAEAWGCDEAEVRKAYMFLSDVGEVAAVAFKEGRRGIQSVTLQLFRPVRPMLAEMAYDLRNVLKQHGGVTALEYKYDGIRVQIHAKEGKIKVFSRRLSDITGQVPDVVSAVRSHIKAESFVLDGEAVGYVEGKPVPFQDIARRVQRQRELDKFLRKVPLKLFLFDILYLDGEVLVDLPYEERWKKLSSIASQEILVKRIVTGSLEEAEKFYRAALEEGHEGVMAKRLDSNYEPGTRGKKWFKVKSADTIDCVIIAAEWGHGRRSGWLSDYHLAVLDDETGGYVMVGKTFKGLTDEEFEEMTKRLLELKISERGYVVYVAPKIVVEVAYSEIQRSPRYRSGFALRFARITRIRWEKSPREITTLSDLRKRYEMQQEKKAELT